MCIRNRIFCRMCKSYHYRPPPPPESVRVRIRSTERSPHAHCCCADIIRAGCLVRDIDVTYPFASYATSSNFSKHKSRQKLDSKKKSYNNNKLSREKMLLLCYMYLMENNLNNAKYKDYN